MLDDPKLELDSKDTPFRSMDNNNFYTSTPSYKNANGNVSNLSLDTTNAMYSLTGRNYENEQLMNSINEDESSSDCESDSSSEAERPETFGLVTSDGKKLAFKNKGKPITTDKRPVKKITEAAKPDRKGVKKLNSKSTNGGNTTTIIADIEADVKKIKYRHTMDKTYYIAKEILMTELTYKKDLDVINVWFRDEVSKEEPEECSILMSLIPPLAQAHGSLVKDLEQRLQGWDGKGGPKAAAGRIADVLLAHLPPLLPFYEEYLDGHVLILERLDEAFKKNQKFEQLYRDFETQKYQSLLERLLTHYGPSHPDRADCRTACDTLKELMTPVRETLEHSENLATLCELQRNIVGFDSLIQPGRKFIRHGCLLKHSRKGYQQRMFFLFSDILLYTSRSQATLQFKVHGHMPLRGVLIEEPEGELAYNGLIIYGGNRALTVAANSPEEKDCWKEDLQNAIQQARDKLDTKTTYLSLKSCSSSDEHVDQLSNEVSTQTKPQPQRSNTTVHVCWHRNTSISTEDELLAVENQLSGYLLRKFKSSNGWQKLWVVFTEFCLFFYKGCMDEVPLACLPLLGYSVGPPEPEDEIAKDFVFKLQYKNHIYFFRAESEYTYSRHVGSDPTPYPSITLAFKINAHS
ncbi:hypothetical protein HUJ05_004241 [Dendroctonus ponderosae]|nr:hypothetical protein HUJ05_004241 [Dendroctonus ponderosae]